MISKLVCFFVCHGGPADQLATISEKCKENGYEVQFYASGPALKKLQDRKVENIISFDAENLSIKEESFLADQLAKKCLKGGVVITEMCHSFSSPLLKSLAKEGLHPLAYYDNGEPYVPGGYSETVAKASSFATKVIFANANLAKAPIYEKPGMEIHLPLNKRVGLGYYPLEQADKMAKRREVHHSAARTQFLADHKIRDQGQKILTYFGGNNTEYFEKAFPAFLSFLTEGMKLKDLSNVIIVLQQHPGAKTKNIDGQELQKWVETQSESKLAPKIIFSRKSSDDMQVITDGALYYQTSMGPLFAFAGIPRAQVGHEIYNDILVRGGLCYVATTPEMFIHAISEIKEEPVSEEQKKVISNSLGIRENWFEIFETAIHDIEPPSFVQRLVHSLNLIIS